MQQTCRQWGSVLKFRKTKQIRPFADIVPRGGRGNIQRGNICEDCQHIKLDPSPEIKTPRTTCVTCTINLDQWVSELCCAQNLGQLGHESRSLLSSLYHNSVLCPQPNLVGSRFSAKSIGLDRRAQLLSPSFDNAVTITGCSRGPRSPYRTGVSPTEYLSGMITWHCLRIFLVRDTGSNQRVFAI